MNYNFDERVQANWGDFNSYQFSNTCPYAELLKEWAEPVVADAEKQRDLMTIYQAKLLLTDKFFFIRSRAPKAHRFRMADSGHLCVWHTFERFYYRLDLAQTTIIPPLYLPEPKETKVIREPRQGGVIYLGEVE
jgi:hypothetical protein